MPCLMWQRNGRPEAAELKRVRQVPHAQASSPGEHQPSRPLDRGVAAASQDVFWRRRFPPVRRCVWGRDARHGRPKGAQRTGEQQALLRDSRSLAKRLGGGTEEGPQVRVEGSNRRRLLSLPSLHSLPLKRDTRKNSVAVSRAADQCHGMLQQPAAAESPAHRVKSLRVLAAPCRKAALKLHPDKG